MPNKFQSRPINNHMLLFFLSAFQLFTGYIAADAGKKFQSEFFMCIVLYIAMEWIYLLSLHTFARKRNFELEMIAFFLSGIGLVVVGSIDPDSVKRQLLMILVGVIGFIALVWVLRDPKKCMYIRPVIAILALVLLAFNLVIAGTTNGARNWITLGPITFQPSEFIKIAYIFVGCLTLENIQRKRNQILFVAFSGIIALGLAAMRDFGTALIFFVTFLVLIFMTTGSFKIGGLACLGVGAAGGLVLKLKPYVRRRFEAHNHIWELADDAGFQQSRVLIGMASGGLFGVGIGNGYVRNIYASTNDAIFGVICEEWGFLFGLLIVLAFLFLAVTTFFVARNSRSAFYTIGAFGACALLLCQCSLNVFGITDVIPLTGVTIPFISQGGSSIISCWTILAFIKAADSRTYNNAGGRRR